MKRFFTLISILMIFSLRSQTPTMLWAYGMGSTITAGNAERMTDIEVASNGNVYTTGMFHGTMDADVKAGTYTVAPGNSGSNSMLLAKYDPNANLIWAKAVQGYTAAGGTYVEPYECEIDPNGNMYVTGWFTGTIDFDPGAGVTNLVSTGSFNFDIFVAKYDVNGNFVFAKAMNGTGTDIGRTLQLDNQGNIYIGATFYNTVDFDPGAGVFNLSANGTNMDAALVKLDNNGNFLWAKPIGFGTLDEYITGIVIDANGDVVICGDFGGLCDFDPSASTANLNSAGSLDIFIAKYTNAGNYISCGAVGGTLTDNRSSLKADGSNYYLTGTFGGTADFDMGASTSNLITTGGNDIFLAKYSYTLGFVFAKKIGGTTNEQAADYNGGLSIDNASNLYVYGMFSGTADFDPSAGTATLTSAGSNDPFLAKYDLNGNFLMVGNLAGTGNDLSNGACVEPGGGAYYITGIANSPTIDLDPGSGTNIHTVSGTGDLYFGKYAFCTIPTQPGAVTGNTAVCAGSAASLYSVAPVSGATSYTWSLPGGWTGTSSSNTISASPGTSGVFSVMAVNACGSSIAKTYTVIVNPSPTVTALTSSSVICGPPFQQTATLTANGANTYTWNPGGTNTVIVVSPSVTTTYTLTGTDLNGCTNSFVLTQSVSTCASLGELSNSSVQLRISPNPNQGIFTIENNAPCVANVYNALGELIHSVRLNTNRAEVDLSDMPVGIYFIRANETTIKFIRN